MAEWDQIPVTRSTTKSGRMTTPIAFASNTVYTMGLFFIGVAQETAHAFQGKKIDGQFEFTRDKAVYVNHYYFCDADFGPLFITPLGNQAVPDGHEWARRQMEKKGSPTKPWPPKTHRYSHQMKDRPVVQPLGSLRFSARRGRLHHQRRGPPVSR
jgi:hypothetical protein